MESELINGVPSSALATHCRDATRKKRRSAKLKQCKLDARRVQWLSQCDKACKEDIRVEWRQNCGRGDSSIKDFGVRKREEENGGGSVQHGIDLESPSSSPTSILLGGKDCGENVTNSSNSSSSSTSSGGCCSGSITEDEEGDDDTLDNWEAFADALAGDEKQEIEQSENSCFGSEPDPEPVPQSGGMKNKTGSDVWRSKTECSRVVASAVETGKAWRLDDAFRPQSLPHLSKKLSFPTTDCHFGQRGVLWAAPSSCPVCFEDLDSTDSSFLPCSCGFRLCLFCHKRILEEDGRCPACRKPYERNLVVAEPCIPGSSLAFRLARSCSMAARS